MGSWAEWRTRWRAIVTREGARALLWAAALYLFTTAVFLALAGSGRLVAHSPYNHFALLAEGWLEGRTDLGGAPPTYAGRNDFAFFEGRWFVTFPGFPALLLMPWVALAGTAERVSDAQFFIALAGVGPAVTFLTLEKLGRLGYSACSERVHLGLALLFAFGSVYFFVAVQGTVWFAAHVVAVALVASFAYASIEARQPLLAGCAIGLLGWTRPPLALAAAFFVFEALRVHPRPGAWATRWVRRYDWAAVGKKLAIFAAPVFVAAGLAMGHNQLRFGSPLDFGYEHLVIAWRPRIETWGLFHYHYLARNLGVVLTSLPWFEPGGPVPFRINVHGLALWVTTPLYLTLLWRKPNPLNLGLGMALLAAAVPSLFYHNSGWVQFGYRFSTDYQVFLFLLLALGGWHERRWFWALGALGVAINTFGAVSFDRRAFADYYYWERTQQVLYQPD